MRTQIEQVAVAIAGGRAAAERGRLFQQHDGRAGPCRLIPRDEPGYSAADNDNGHACITIEETKRLQ